MIRLVVAGFFVVAGLVAEAVRVVVDRRLVVVGLAAAPDAAAAAVAVGFAAEAVFVAGAFAVVVVREVRRAVVAGLRVVRPRVVAGRRVVVVRVAGRRGRCRRRGRALTGVITVAAWIAAAPTPFAAAEPAPFAADPAPLAAAPAAFAALVAPLAAAAAAAALSRATLAASDATSVAASAACRWRLPICFRAFSADASWRNRFASVARAAARRFSSLRSSLAALFGLAIGSTSVQRRAARAPSYSKVGRPVETDRRQTASMPRSARTSR